jgi:solute carrier family 35
VGWYGLQLVNIPLFLAVRRTTTAFTLLAEYLILGKRQSLPVVGSVMLILLGALVAGWESLGSDWLGLAYTMANNVLTAVAMSTTKRFSDATRTGGFGLVFYNALVALPLCLVGATLSGEWEYTAYEYPRVGEAVNRAGREGAGGAGGRARWGGAGCTHTRAAGGEQ